MELLTSFYYPKNKTRESEIILTLKNNLDKDFISRINLCITENDYKKLKNSNTIKDYEKVNIILKNDQPTYNYLIKLASTFDNKIICICNSDIEFEIGDIKIFDKLKDDMCYFLTRHESNDTCPLIKNYGGSHDAFIFKSDILKDKIKDKDLSYINYIQNTPGIEALLTIYFTEKLNYIIFNPCFEIKLIHHHDSNYRTYHSVKPVGYTSEVPNCSYGDAVWCKYMFYPCKLL